MTIKDDTGTVLLSQNVTREPSPCHLTTETEDPEADDKKIKKTTCNMKMIAI